MRGGKEHKVSLYADDDLLVYISNPLQSVPIIMSILDQFGKISGYKINFSKSVIFPINPKTQLETLSSLPFKVVNSFKYLGITITKDFSTLFKENILNLYESTQHTFKKRSNLPLSLAGRINTVKMSILPKFLFLFQCIPVYINKSFFKNLDRIITQYIWNKKNPRVKKIYLQRIKPKGGMGLLIFNCITGHVI